MAGTILGGGLAYCISGTRPTLNQVVVTLTPSSLVGYLISVDFRNGSGGALTNLVRNVNFPYAAPAALDVGTAASTGGTYTNTLPAGTLQTTWGSDSSCATAVLAVTPAAFLSVTRTNGRSITLTLTGQITATGHQAKTLWCQWATSHK